MRIPQLSLGLRKSAASRWNTGPKVCPARVRVRLFSSEVFDE